MYTYLAIERTPGFLKTEIVVQILVREVAAFKRDIIAAILQTIAQCQVMGELVGYHETSLAIAHIGVGEEYGG